MSCRSGRHGRCTSPESVSCEPVSSLYGVSSRTGTVSIMPYSSYMVRVAHAAGDPPSWRRWAIQMAEWVFATIAARGACGVVVSALSTVSTQTACRSLDMHPTCTVHIRLHTRGSNSHAAEHCRPICGVQRGVHCCSSFRYSHHLASCPHWTLFCGPAAGGAGAAVAAAGGPPAGRRI